MSPDAQSAYSAALDPWRRKAERERKVINHVSWDGENIVVTMIPRKEAAELLL